MDPESHGMIASILCPVRPSASEVRFTQMGYINKLDGE